MKLLAPALLLAAGCAHPTALVAVIAGEGVVTSVVDGDTIHAEVDGHLEKIRIKGLNSPETVAPGKPVQCGGPEASAYAHKTLDGKHVRLVTDPGDLHDRYGRLVAEVWLVNGHSYALEAVTAGMGRAYVYDRKHPASNADAIAAAEAQARAGHVGMWGHCG